MRCPRTFAVRRSLAVSVQGRSNKTRWCRDALSTGCRILGGSTFSQQCSSLVIRPSASRSGQRLGWMRYSSQLSGGDRHSPRRFSSILTARRRVPPPPPTPPPNHPKNQCGIHRGIGWRLSRHRVYGSSKHSSIITRHLPGIRRPQHSRQSRISGCRRLRPSHSRLPPDRIDASSRRCRGDDRTPGIASVPVLFPGISS